MSPIPRSFRSGIQQRSFGLVNPNVTNKHHIGYGRVLDVIMDSSHPKWNELGGSQAQYGVFYQRLYIDESPTEESSLNFAYCGRSNFRKVPVKNEIVRLYSGVRADLSEELNRIYTERFYWESTIPVWNHPHLNAYPDTIEFGDGEADTGKYFEENGDIRPLQLCPGDFSIEGRHGNTIRLGGTYYPSSPIAKQSDNGKPYTLLVVGHKESAEDAIYEDVNEDKTSIYLVSDHKVPLKQANEKRKAWKVEKQPDLAKDYKGSQIILNSDRIYLNAKEDTILLSAKNGVGVNGKLIALDGEKYVSFDADKIYLGTNAFSEIDPVLLGTKTVNWLNNLCTSLDKLLTTMGTTTSPAQLPALALMAQAVQKQVLQYKASLPNLKSKKSFVE